MAKKSFPLAEVYGLLEPGPVVLVSTAREGRANIMTMSWQTMLDFEPPVLACVISSNNFTFEILEETGECVLNIPTVELAEKVVGCGNTSGRKVDKFQHFGLTQAAASCVKAPLIDECYANLECKVVDRQMVDTYNLFVLEVLQAWINPSLHDPRTIHHRGQGAFMVAGETIKLASKSL
ncbi:MAG: flavin reductase family protein [Proteobacteria bacterium]|nr:flavin reductase family protein [Pseudomonadota bacterium]MBU0968140.1 flavin reductase family protein [Pseudomonadota bacterium]